MSTRTRSLTFFLSLLSFFLFLALSSGSVAASTAENVGGWAWSSNVGWVKLNNCTNPGTPSTCSGPDSIGVNFLQTTPGTGSGYAWSSNIGWISFNASATSGCPSGFSQCGAYVDWAAPNGDGSFNIKGWARACSVFVSGCSGTLKGADALGGWDGWIALGDTNTADAITWGLRVNSDRNAISGFAWGSEVVGWLNFYAATYNFSIAGTPTVDLVATPSTVTAYDTSTLTVTATNFPGSISCTINQSVGTIAMASAGGNNWASVAPHKVVNPSSSTTYIATCTGVSISAQDSATVTVISGTPVTATLTANPTSIASGNSSTLTWSSNNATACTGQNFSTGPSNATSGTRSVSPSVTTLYTVTCTNAAGTSNDDATVTVTGTLYECNDGIDNDGDGNIDYPSDLQCTSPTDNTEAGGATECADGIDNSDTEDALADTLDPGCHTDGNAADPATYDPTRTSENNKKKPIFIEF